MIYRCGLFNRRPGLDDAGFHAHWRNVHGPLAAKLPGMGTYRQNHILERIYEMPDSPVQAIDGISQLSFDSVAHMERSDASAEYQACKEDIPKFQGGITILVIEPDEVVARDGSRGGVKVIWVSTRRPGERSEGLRLRWLAANRDAGRDLPGVRGYMQNFVTDRGHPVAAGVPSGDAAGAEAVSELWFDDAASARAAVQSDAGKRLLHGDPMLAPVGIYLVEEIHVV
ncbi:EthD protein [Variovorax sp. PBL-H6]|uniref:EthD family reductase n=1 Tax=Variovorax sp. PBL-H6 TaxID=434009 RepID=UPI001317EBF3|nr:EthD family reductase [Variovorax sp. PBL-H6]VTU31907.1 EthD protein [Variovorax sp. PBL-H6]